MLVKTYAYILRNGAEGLHLVAEGAVANATYIRERLKLAYKIPYDTPTMHEFVMSDEWQHKQAGVSTLDIAKRLIDYGFHPPTIYFPLIVDGAMMVEPTETETRRDLDELANAFLEIAKEAEKDPDLLKNAPHDTPIARPDETRAAREPVLAG